MFKSLRILVLSAVLIATALVSHGQQGFTPTIYLTCTSNITNVDVTAKFEKSVNQTSYILITNVTFTAPGTQLITPHIAYGNPVYRLISLTFSYAGETHTITREQLDLYGDYFIVGTINLNVYDNGNGNYSFVQY